MDKAKRQKLFDEGIRDGMRCIVCHKIIDGEVPGLIRTCANPECRKRNEEASKRLLREIFKKDKKQ